MIDHFFFYFALLIEKLKRISVKVAYSAALMFRNVNICGSEGVTVFIGVDTTKQAENKERSGNLFVLFIDAHLRRARKENNW